MGVRSYSIPVGMTTRKFYCNKCGSTLKITQKTRTIHRGEPEFKEHSRIGTTYFLSNQIELTEYDFECTCCNTIITYDDQCIIEKIQNYLGNKILSENDIHKNIKKAKADIEKKQKRTKFISTLLGVLFLILIVIFLLTDNLNFSFDFNFVF